jgi:ABC-type multidrug transport system fused ATPase/permease subunit
MISFIKKIFLNSIKLSKKEILIFFLLLLIAASLELLGISLIIPLISIFTDPAKSQVYINSLGFSFLNNNFFFSYLVFFIFLVFLLKYCTTIITEYLMVKYLKKWEIYLISKVINNYFNIQYLDLLRAKEPLITNVTHDIPVFINQGVKSILIFFRNSLILFFLIIFLAVQKGTITISVIFLFCCSLYFFVKKFKNILATSSNKFTDLWNAKYKLFTEISNGYKEIKIQNLKNFFLKRLEDIEISIVKIDIIKIMIEVIPKISIELLLITCFLLVAYFNQNNANEIIPFLGLLAFIVYRCQPLVISLISIFGTLQVYSNQINRGIEILNLSERVDNLDQPINEMNKFFQSNSILKFNNFDFSYNINNSKKIFKNAEVFLEFGKIYGLKGENGTGKSTFADLVAGLIKPQQGEITLNGENINTFNNWTNSVSYLSQNYFLFEDTIQNNITLILKKNEIFNRFQYERSLEFSNLKKELNKFSNGDQTFLYEAGKNLSLGQKQRIALARIVYKNSKIIILDEPTASLDAESAEIAIEFLKKIKNDKLILVISHSNKILDACDEILHVKNNKIILEL